MRVVLHNVYRDRFDLGRIEHVGNVSTAGHGSCCAHRSPMFRPMARNFGIEC